jgi:pyrroline-5-carboxylate reductase
MIASAHPSDEASLKAFRDLGCCAVTDNQSVVSQSDVVFISVKPNVVKTALHDVKNLSSGKLFVSIAMGITLNEIEQILPHDSRVIRVMPNTPAIVQAAASVFVRGAKATADDANLIQNLLQSIGTCDEVSEYMMDPVTALSGSGPAYVRFDLCDNLLHDFSQFFCSHRFSC